MNKLIFATNNEHKVEEMRAILKNDFEIISLKDAGINIDIPEPHDSLEANAREKSFTIYKLTNKNCFSEDTGLEVNALNGAPGVKSARYAGSDRSFDANISYLLQNMKACTNRNARFRTIISLVLNGEETQFEGICEGVITGIRRGGNGFGYDAIFIPDGSEKTFAEMGLEEKNHFSHRKKAILKLIDYLQRL